MANNHNYYTSMKINGILQQTLRYDQATFSVNVIDQRLLPHEFKHLELTELSDFCQAISEMVVRGAPLIGITAAFGLALSIRTSVKHVESAYKALLATRPTAINLKWALDAIMVAITENPDNPFLAAIDKAKRMLQNDIHCCEAIGEAGVTLIKSISDSKNGPVNILTHCNAGWLATIDWGTALAPIYKADAAGIDLHVWVDETRPRNQGASLTAWELYQQGIPHTLISDNTGGHLMQEGLVDLCLVGTDRTAANGDVCNKIGTYLKALAAKDNSIPFYVALPSSTIDWQLQQGVGNIPIELRDPEEITHIEGLSSSGKRQTICINSQSKAVNYGFDVTPARLISGLITEFGIYEANTQHLAELKELLT